MAKPVYFESLQGPIRVRIEHWERIVTPPWNEDTKLVVVTALKAVPEYPEGFIPIYPEGCVIRVPGYLLWDSVKRTGTCRHTFTGKTWKKADISTLEVELVPRGGGFECVPVKGEQDAK